MEFNFNSIGYMESCFATKNGTPRQPSVSAVSKGKLRILKPVFSNPEHSIEGLTEYSHIWIIFVFHLNTNKSTKAKVKPPRMDGLKTGVFSTRSPHRPNPIGLTLAKLDLIQNDTMFLSGIDLVNGTPILDIKPFVSYYDNPNFLTAVPSFKPFSDKYLRNVKENFDFKNSKTEENAEKNKTLHVFNDNKHLDKAVKLSLWESSQLYYNPLKNDDKSYSAQWISTPPILELDVVFSNRALDNLEKYKSVDHKSPYSSNWVLMYLNPEDLQQAIIDVLKADPRSVYRRKKCSDRLYYFTIDNVHVTTWFDDYTSPNCVEVLRIVPCELLSANISSS